jgi:hypothetical protein
MRIGHMRIRGHAGLSLILAVFVLVAQLGAQAHANSHLAKSQDPIQRSAHSGAPCVECSAFAPLLTAVSGASFPVVVAVVDPPTYPASFAAGVHSAAPCTAYRPRAPPAMVWFV